MSSVDFFEAVISIVGKDNAELYRKRFGDLDGPFFGNLSNCEGLAFFIYSTSMGWHAYINGSLWSGNADSSVSVFTAVLNTALAKCPKLMGRLARVYRGYRVDDIPAYLNDFVIGRTVCFPGFTSASMEMDGAFKGNVLFVIDTLNAVSIALFSGNYQENEVLLPAGSIFLVTDIVVHTDRALIYLEEVSVP